MENNIIRSRDNTIKRYFPSHVNLCYKSSVLDTLVFRSEGIENEGNYNK